MLVSFPTEIRKSVINTIIQARFAGHLAADGSVGHHGDNRDVSICFNTEETEFVAPTIDSMHASFGIHNETQSNANGTLLVKRSSKHLLSDFARKIVVGKGEKKKFTSEVTLLDPELQLHVLGAYIQSDGTYNEQNDVFEITTYSKDLANQLLLMFYRCGILARVNKQPISSSNKTFKTKNEFRYIVNVPSSECGKISEYVPGKSKTLRLRNKGSNWRFFWKNFVVSRVTSNKSFQYEGNVYDVRLPPTFTVTANGISVHQCRFYYDNEPKVAAAIDFYGNFSMSGFKLECKSKEILKYFEQV